MNCLAFKISWLCARKCCFDHLEWGFSKTSIDVSIRQLFIQIHNVYCPPSYINRCYFSKFLKIKIISIESFFIFLNEFINWNLYALVLVRHQWIKPIINTHFQFFFCSNSILFCLLISNFLSLNTLCFKINNSTIQTWPQQLISQKNEK